MEEYAQSVGKSVEDAWGDWASMTAGSRIVMNNAEEAFRTCGLSANEYMETVTSFSAAMIASLDGDTAEAAKKADMAITDMSDNANKMGSDMESIQNAYNGFAKQNYTMLDNLKLGYGGTKEEMQRLLDDAEKLSGVKYDISSYADIVDAIHVVQTEMGITGTTAKEASSTISGSVSSMKASWQNLVTGIADDNADFDALIDNFVESAITAADNILPRIEIAIGGIGSLIEKLLPVIVEKIPGIINDILPGLVESGVNMIISLIKGIEDSFPEIMSAGGSILSALIEGIIEILPTLGTVAYDIVTSLLTGITDNADSALQSGSEMLLQFITGIADKIPELLTMGMNAIISLATALTEPDTLGNIIDAGIKLIVSLITGLLDALPQLIDAIPTIITNIVTAIVENLPMLLEAAIQILGALAKFLVENVPKLIDAIPTLFENLVNAFSEMDWGSIGSNIIDGIWNGLKSGWDWLVNSVKDLAGNLLQGAKDALGIHSPSKKFAYLGEMCVAGFDEGIEDLMNPDTMTRNINASLDSMKMSVKGGSGFSGESTNTTTQTFNIYQPVKSPSEMMRAARLEAQYGLAGA